MIADSGILPEIFDPTPARTTLPPPQPRFFTELGQAEAHGRALQAWAEQVDLEDKVAQGQAVALNLVHGTMNELNLRDLMRVRGRLIHNLMRGYGAQTEYEFPQKRTPGPWRVGIFLNHLEPQPELRAAAAIAHTLPRDFLVRVYSIIPGPMQRFLDAVVVGNDCKASIPIIRDDELDVALIAGNTSMVSSPLLPIATHRIARLQIASMWSLITTGLPHSDVYLSGSSSDDQTQYTETLRHMEGAAHCFAALPGDLPLRKRTRPQGKLRYVSAANFYKITPECLSMWASILNAVPDAELMLYPFSPSWDSAYPVMDWANYAGQFFQDRGVDPSRLLIWSGKLSDAPDGHRLEDGDVYLDSLPVSGATGLIEPCQHGIPVVTDIGLTLRSSMGWDMLERSWFPVYLGYRDAAIMLGQNATVRAETSKYILDIGAKGFGFLDTKAQGKNLGATLLSLLTGRS